MNSVEFQELSKLRFIKFFIYMFGLSAQRIRYPDNNFEVPAVWVHSESVTPAAMLFSDLAIFNYVSLMDASAQDYLGKRHSFLYFYVFFSYSFNSRLFLFTQVKLGVPLFTLTKVFDSAGWMESETWDMFGIYFAGNPVMVRLLTDYGFKGFPLSKDFPVSGYKEMIYSVFNKRTIYVDVELMQEYSMHASKEGWEKIWDFFFKSSKL